MRPQLGQLKASVSGVTEASASALWVASGFFRPASTPATLAPLEDSPGFSAGLGFTPWLPHSRFDPPGFSALAVKCQLGPWPHTFALPHAVMVDMVHLSQALDWHVAGGPGFSEPQLIQGKEETWLSGNH